MAISDSNRGSKLLAFAVATAIAIGCMLLPDSITTAIRATARDAMAPAQRVVKAGLNRVEQIHSANQLDVHPDAARNGAAGVEQRELAIRRLLLANEDLQRKLQQTERAGVSPYHGTPGDPLLVAELVEARVIGRERAISDLAGLLVTPEEAGQLRAGLPVLEATQMWLDQGQQMEVLAGLPVFSGRAVIGRVAHSGSHVATIQLITDKKYRGRAQLAREGASGLVFGDEGILEGAGGHCLLRHIPATTAVSVGDDVYTGRLSESLPYPMYYGTVEFAELPAGASEWSIRVRPAVAPSDVESVLVLRQSVNTSRGLGN